MHHTQFKLLQCLLVMLFFRRMIISMPLSQLDMTSLSTLFSLNMYNIFYRITYSEFQYVWRSIWVWAANSTTQLNHAKELLSLFRFCL